MFPLYLVGLQLPSWESNSEQKTNLGNKNQLLEELVCLYSHQACTGMLLARVRAQVALSGLADANSTQGTQTVLSNRED